MARMIKLIWDFRGPAALKTAEHHEIHLKEFIALEKIEPNITGYQALNDMHSLAFMVVNEADMINVRDRLKPHRGELYTARWANIPSYFEMELAWTAGHAQIPTKINSKLSANVSKWPIFAM